MNRSGWNELSQTMVNYSTINNDKQIIIDKVVFDLKTTITKTYIDLNEPQKVLYIDRVNAWDKNKLDATIELFYVLLLDKLLTIIILDIPSKERLSNALCLFESKFVEILKYLKDNKTTFYIDGILGGASIDVDELNNIKEGNILISGWYSNVYSLSDEISEGMGLPLIDIEIPVTCNCSLFLNELLKDVMPFNEMIESVVNELLPFIKRLPSLTINESILTDQQTNINSNESFKFRHTTKELFDLGFYIKVPKRVLENKTKPSKPLIIEEYISVSSIIQSELISILRKSIDKNAKSNAKIFHLFKVLEISNLPIDVQKESYLELIKEKTKELDLSYFSLSEDERSGYLSEYLSFEDYYKFHFDGKIDFRENKGFKDCLQNETDILSIKLLKEEYDKLSNTVKHENVGSALAFKTHLDTKQLTSLWVQLKEPKNGFIAPDTKEYNFKHVFGEKLPDNVQFEQIKWIKKARNKSNCKAALIDLCTLIYSDLETKKEFFSWAENHFCTDTEPNIRLKANNKTNSQFYNDLKDIIKGL